MKTITDMTIRIKLILLAQTDQLKFESRNFYMPNYYLVPIVYCSSKTTIIECLEIELPI